MIFIPKDFIWITLSAVNGLAQTVQTYLFAHKLEFSLVLHWVQTLLTFLDQKKSWFQRSDWVSIKWSISLLSNTNIKKKYLNNDVLASSLCVDTQDGVLHWLLLTSSPPPDVCSSSTNIKQNFSEILFRYLNIRRSLTSTQNFPSFRIVLSVLTPFYVGCAHSRDRVRKQILAAN